jgi:hypothetical protein
MSKVIGWTILVLLVGTLAMAWTGPPMHRTASAPAIGISPHEMHLKLGVASLPTTRMDDESVVFVSP